jgi:hypothetical protein
VRSGREGASRVARFAGSRIRTFSPGVATFVTGIAAQASAVLEQNRLSRTHLLRRSDYPSHYVFDEFKQPGLKRVPPSIIKLLRNAKERDALSAEITSAETMHKIHVDRAAIEAKVQS